MIGLESNFKLSFHSHDKSNLVMMFPLKVKVAQSCPTLCYPMDYTVHGILQAKILEWVASPFSRDLPNPGIKPRSPILQVDSLLAEPGGKPNSD